MGLLQDLINAHPRLSMFGGLALGMVAVLLIATRSSPLEIGQKATLIFTTILLAGLCTWIVHWEKEPE